MSKQSRTKKKRQKAYTGTDAVPDQPVVHRYKAEVKTPAREWWEAKRGPFKIIGGIIAIVAFLVWMLVEAVRIIF